MLAKWMFEDILATVNGVADGDSADGMQLTMHHCEQEHEATCQSGAWKSRSKRRTATLQGNRHRGEEKRAAVRDWR